MMADTRLPGIDLNANQGPRLVGSMIVLIVLPTLFVIARLVSRKVAQAGYWWDDLLVVFACVSNSESENLGCTLLKRSYRPYATFNASASSSVGAQDC